MYIAIQLVRLNCESGVLRHINIKRRDQCYVCTIYVNSGAVMLYVARLEWISSRLARALSVATFYMCVCVAYIVCCASFVVSNALRLFRRRRRRRGVGRCLLGIPFGSLETDIDGYERKTTTTTTTKKTRSVWNRYLLSQCVIILIHC